jgi:hypothetical protein
MVEKISSVFYRFDEGSRQRKTRTVSEIFQENEEDRDPTTGNLIIYEIYFVYIIWRVYFLVKNREIGMRGNCANRV